MDNYAKLDARTTDVLHNIVLQDSVAFSWRKPSVTTLSWFDLGKKDSTVDWYLERKGEKHHSANNAQ